MSSKVENLRRIVQENIRIQRGGSETIDYVDVSRALLDIVARQNHVVFGRRGWGSPWVGGTSESKSLSRATRPSRSTELKRIPGLEMPADKEAEECAERCPGKNQNRQDEEAQKGATCMWSASRTSSPCPYAGSSVSFPSSRPFPFFGSFRSWSSLSWLVVFPLGKRNTAASSTALSLELRCLSYFSSLISGRTSKLSQTPMPIRQGKK
jgi:hypothetical protein